LIRSFEGTSLIEYPGKIASVVFFGGCNLHCPYCHNPELVRPDLLADQYTLSPDMVLGRLQARRGFIEGLSITGGEPLLSPGLPDFIRRVRRETGLPVKLDTNGTLPERLREVLDIVDYVAMDLKAAPGGYPKATGGRATFDDIRESLDLVRGLPEYEIRTTMVPGVVDRDDVVQTLRRHGPLKRYVLQRFRGEKTLSEVYRDLPPYPKGYLEETAELVAPHVEEVEVRA
jgi:pyruvate formate lyase activating enzyme